VLILIWSRGFALYRNSARALFSAMDADGPSFEQSPRVLMDYCLRHCAGRPPSYKFHSGGHGDYLCQVSVPKASPVKCTGTGISASKKKAKEIAAFQVVQRLVSEGFVEFKSTPSPKQPIHSRKRRAEDISRAEEIEQEKNFPLELEGLQSARSQNELDHRLQGTWETEFNPLLQHRAVGGSAEVRTELRPSLKQEHTSQDGALDVLEVSDDETPRTANHLEPAVLFDDEHEEVILLAEDKEGEVTSDWGTDGESHQALRSSSLEHEVAKVQLGDVGHWNISQTTMDENSVSQSNSQFASIDLNASGKGP